MANAIGSRWFRYRDNRNDTAHDDGEAFARETLTLMPDFLEDVSRLADRLDGVSAALAGEDANAGASSDRADWFPSSEEVQ